MKKYFKMCSIVAAFMLVFSFPVAASEADSASTSGAELTATSNVNSNNKHADKIKGNDVEEQEEQEDVDDEDAKQDNYKKSLQELRKELGKNDNKELKGKIKEIQDELKELRKSDYTEEELTAIQAKVGELIEEYKDITVLPVENIDVAGKKVKFDMPPVIKEGRTLIPVRAITEGLGAEVSWNKDTNEVTITKDGTTIVLTIGSNEVTVNGEKVELDAAANIYGQRTYVPIRFISETLNLKVNWDENNQVVEIEPETDETVAETTETTTQTTTETTTQTTTETTTQTTTGTTTEPTTGTTTEPTTGTTTEPTTDTTTDTTSETQQ